MSKKYDVLDLVDKQLTLGDVCFIKSKIKSDINQPIKLKHKYIKFEIDKGKDSYSHHRLIGSYYKLQEDGTAKTIKEYILSCGSISNNPLLELIMPMLNSIAFDNLNLFLENKSKYFEK